MADKYGPVFTMPARSSPSPGALTVHTGAKCARFTTLELLSNHRLATFNHIRESESLTLGATDTTTVTLTWALALLLNNRQVLKRAQDELQTHVGNHRQVKESDMKELPYLQAIVKETLRLYPPAQLLPPREAVEDCCVGGYHVPTGTRLFLNLWKIHRDPQVWADPLEFQPERFLTINIDVDVRGQHFELIPFGSGRRACPGISFALQVVQFSLASLLHSFEFATPSYEVVDMTESNGFTTIKATPLQVLLIPRLPAEIYG
ncbi:hypothetical protein TEA_024104 [Camellia sinensis var. sinensis]|uniref:Uncharacterized protein n=1 Tax=Camellia sinensis var. sinensis TaxID=542762 RepID=A0A4S4EY83_CAMSN|nr:hypothetical protein TEA_024104 [Camellia sinensis var. sinensis]